jgi:poly-gamma-glutamate capsule biosynthesis protein CapA/YwtB (metallophosphatase superfamily)
MDDPVSKQPRLVLVGDVAMETADPSEVMANIRPYMEQSAAAFCNCEWPLTDRGAPWPGKAGRVVRSSPPKVSVYAGFDVVSLANNHIMNYGAEGLAQTLQVLDAAGIRHCGAGLTRAEAHRPAIVEAAGRRIALLAYTSVFAPGFEAGENCPGMAVVRVGTRYRVSKRLEEMPGSPMEIETVPDPEDFGRLLDDVRAARQDADIVVLSWHWGVSMGYRYLVPYQVDLGRAAIEAGADLVIGHHPHALQGIEVHQGKIIAYSTGHCGFDMEHESFADDSILLEMPLDRPLVGEVLVRPLGNSVRKPTILSRQAGKPCLERLANLSRPLGTDFLAEGDGARPVRSERPFNSTAAFGMFH